MHVPHLAYLSEVVLLESRFGRDNFQNSSLFDSTLFPFIWFWKKQWPDLNHVSER